MASLNPELHIERSYLSAALGPVGKAVSPRNPLAILSHVHLVYADGKLTITATDLDTTIRASIPARLANGDFFDVCLPASQLTDYISKCNDAPLVLENSDGKIVARSGKSRLTILSSPGEDFPDPTEVTDYQEIKLPSGILKDMLRMTAFAASKEESRSLLMGVLFECAGNVLRVVATDTHRLAHKETDLNGDYTNCAIIVPAKPLVELERVLKNNSEEMVSLRFNSSQVQFLTAEMALTSRLLDGQFPNYEKVIPKTAERRATVEREDLLSAVRRVDVVARASSQKMVCKFGNDLLTLTADSPESGAAFEEVQIQLDGAPLTIAFNARYLLEVLGLITDDRLVFDLNGPLNPGILRTSSGLLYVVMPMQA